MERSVVEALLGLAGCDEATLAAAELRLADNLAQLGQLGVSPSALEVAGQAYIRAVGRVVAAEAEIISALTASVDGGDTEAELDTRRRALVALAGPAGRDTFDVLHASMLARALGGEASPFGKREASGEPVTVAHVDVIGSTALLENATLEQTKRLVDGLFSSAQSAIRGRSVEATKYAGDGVFLAGSDPVEVARASLACLRSLADSHGLPARAGLARGPVVLRAGDLFGLPVNLAHVLTKAARPGTLLASAVAAEGLPSEMRAESRCIDVAGLAAPLEVCEVV